MNNVAKNFQKSPNLVTLIQGIIFVIINSLETVQSQVS